MVVVGLAANFFYFLGPVVESALNALWGDEVLPTGPALYRMGLTFSVGLVFVPFMISILMWVARIIGLA